MDHIGLGRWGAIGIGATGDGTPDNGGGAEALLPSGPGRLSSGVGASDAEDVGTWCDQIHEAADEGTSPRDDGADMECGPKATAGIDRSAVGRGLGWHAGAENCD